jgi:flagellin
MALSVNSNTASLRAQRNLGVATSQLQKTFEKLSSGLRIVRASDDAAGLSIADALKRDATLSTVAIRNANDGISLISIADGALGEVSNILTRMAELAEQAASGTLSTSQRSALELEFVALGSEISRIATTTEFNGIKVLSSTGTLDLQVGIEASSNSQITVSMVQGTLEYYGLGNGAQLTYSLNATSTTLAQDSARSALTAVSAAIGSLGLSRGVLGAAESRLNSAVSNLQIARENLYAAESQIRDVDVATEAANLTRLTILQQAAAAVLAQANQQPSLVLDLLS